MGRSHRHDDGTVHTHHDADHDPGHDHGHQHDGDDGAHPDPDNGDGGARRRHGDHTGYATATARVQVLESIFGENDRLAAANRADFDAAGIRVVNARPPIR